MMKNISQDQKKKSAVWGFTLIELMVASAIFIVVSMVVVSIFLIAIKNQRRDFQVQNLQDNARYIIEMMVKEIRMSPGIEKPESTGETISLKILNQDGTNRVRYRFENKGGTSECVTDCITRIEKIVGGQPDIGVGEKGNPLNSSQVNVNGRFYVVNESGRRMVTITMTFSPAGANEPKITVQNTIAVRIY